MVTPIQDKPWPVQSKLPCTYLVEAILAFLQGLGNCHQESRKNDATFMRLQPKVSCTAMRNKKNSSSSTKNATCPFTAEIAEINRLENSFWKFPITTEKRWKKRKHKAIFRGAAGCLGAESWYSWYPFHMAEEGDAPLIVKDPPTSIITRSYVWLQSCYKPLLYEHVERQLLNIDIAEKATLWNQLVMSQIWMNMVPTFKNYMEFRRRSSELWQFHFEFPERASRLLPMKDQGGRSWVFEREVDTYL